MKKEYRNGDRYCFNLNLQLDGDLFLLVDERTFEIWKLLDISPFGTGLSVDEEIATGSRVILQYQCKGDDIKVSGTVLWSGVENSDEEGGGFRMGICFHKSETVLNVALFKALTESTLKMRQCYG